MDKDDRSVAIWRRADGVQASDEAAPAVAAKAMKRLVVIGAAVLLAVALAAPASSARGQAAPLDFAIPGGHFYQQANGQGGAGDTGYAVTDADGIPFWDAYRRLGGPTVLGYPATQRFTWDGYVVQAMQKVIFQWQPASGQVAFVNVLDRLHDAGKDSWLQAYRQTPPPDDTAADASLAWPAVERRHWAMLDANSAIKAAYFADPDPLDHFGLPMAAADEGNSVVVRAQRAVFQYWKSTTAWAPAGAVTIANAGDLAKEAGLFPAAAITPGPIGATGAGNGAAVAAPQPATTPTAGRAPSHDWRSPGFVSAVGGQLYDPSCVPLRAVGSNTPNLPYAGDISANLAWMGAHHLRWLRVFATGHQLAAPPGPTDAAAAIAALQSLLQQVQAFNAQHAPSAAIYVLVSLTDYYPPGVPGDGHAYDHPIFTLTPVLPAPWFRVGVPRFNFDQEHGYGLATNLANYEVYYKPWVEKIVPALAGNPALLGWQLGNELKARGSPRNGISADQAYGWYLAFTRDMTDDIRSRDPNHLIFMGAQYMAELTDWEYRPKNTLQPDLLPEYRQLVDEMTSACGAACWNVWSLTAYDFNPYPIDDAQVFEQAKIATVATEYGFTLGATATMASAFGGDRAAAVAAGAAIPWQRLDGTSAARQWSVPELIAMTGLAGIAPWGSPAPGPTAAYDEDGARGVTGAADQAALWSAWTDVAAGLQTADAAIGPSTACQALRSVG